VHLVAFIIINKLYMYFAYLPVSSCCGVTFMKIFMISFYISVTTDMINVCVGITTDVIPFCVS